jgi:hypothetical protein
VRLSRAARVPARSGEYIRRLGRVDAGPLHLAWPPQPIGFEGFFEGVVKWVA